MATSQEDVYCTLVMSDSYLPGAAVLAHSLRDNGTKKKLACLVTLDTLRPSTLTELKSLYDYILPVDRTGNPNPSNLYLMNRADLLYTFTKIGLWRQTQFRKIVYIDADVVTLRAPDELFDLPASFAAAPDVGWPDIFNTGVMVLTPHMGDYWALKTLAATGDTFDGADQGLLNQYYEHKDWHRLSFAYNCTPSANYQYEPAYRYYKSKISMVHFIGKEKPWMTSRSQTAAPGAYNELLHRWWAVYDAHFKESAQEYSSGRYSPASSPPHVQQATEPEPSAVIAPSEEPKRFEAPSMAWDATRAAPPSESQPEAANFPVQTYTFTEDKNLFRAPKSYPEPPKDMWYKVPESKPAPEKRPPPIFPWEQRGENVPRPTRVFAEDRISPVETPSEEKNEEPLTPLTPITPSIKVTSEDPWTSFESTNAWDQVEGIDAYVRALHQRTRSVGGNGSARPSFSEAAKSPTADPAQQTQFERRESLILTDFPSEIDRPSLPVTPAPMRRPMFWGKERDQAGALPSADGVPDQADWDPTEKLEELRRHSLILTQSDLKMPESKKLPDRAMPGSAVEVPSSSESPTEAPKKVGFAEAVPTIATPDVASPQPVRAGRVQFGAVDFAKEPAKSGEGEVLSPTDPKA